ncbi:MAG: sulfatase [Rhodospirillaceae bacterium]|jgi:arylsulfatase A-like enzyme|nr:sulfatase [Rhodospirillaceae bacterium]MDP6645622.1 sulfatase-like hydrolase/transferase [Rhodospirillales bacterium]|tara:strand:- start:1899 stop:3506 length:1608 start_codon:yes stop_codon:yes gene_type:complete
MANGKKPNFLFIITDQHRADYLGCYGHPIVKTPNIDKIAAGGCRFDRFYVASAVCMPNRATLVTGRMPSVHGVRHNGIPLDRRAATFVELLRNHGYDTALVGKSHLQNMGSLGPYMERPEPEAGKAPAPDHLKDAIGADENEEFYAQETDANWNVGSTFKMDLPFYGFDHVDLCTGHGDKVGGHYTLWLEDKSPGSENLRGPENALPHDYTGPQTWRTAIPEELYPTSYITDKTLEYLDGYKAGGGDKPFFLMMSMPDPHHPFTPPGKYWDMYDPADMEIPASFHANVPPPPSVQWAWNRREDGSHFTGGQSLFATEEKHLREAMALTCGMITMIDDGVGKVLAKLDELGLRDDTIVVFTTDHGDLLGDHQLMLKGPVHYHGLIRVPFIWSDVAGAKTAPSTDAMSGTLDIASTVLDRAGLQPYYGIQGRSLMPEIGGADDQGPGAVLIEQEDQRVYFDQMPPARLHTLVTRRHRLTLYYGNDWGELYDLIDDPDENINLWDDPAHAGTRSEMLETMARRQMALVDFHPLPTATA